MRFNSLSRGLATHTNKKIFKRGEPAVWSLYGVSVYFKSWTLPRDIYSYLTFNYWIVISLEDKLKVLLK